MELLFFKFIYLLIFKAYYHLIENHDLLLFVGEARDRTCDATAKVSTGFSAQFSERRSLKGNNLLQFLSKLYNCVCKTFLVFFYSIMESSERSKPSETKRVIKTASQLQSLKEAYAENKHLPPLGYAKLAEVIGLSRKQVRDWFREEREKERVLKRKRESEDTDFDGAKMRTPKDPDVVEKLEKFYAENRYPDRAAYPKLAEELGLLKKQVMEWFHHRRYLERHSKTENEQYNELRSTKFQDRDYGTAFWDGGIHLGTERVSETTPKSPKSQDESPCNIGKESENAVTKETSESEEESKGLEDDGPKENSSKGFKIRNIKQPHVVRRLERYFRLLKNSKNLDKKSIAEELGLSPIEVSRWFSSRHVKERRLKLKRREEERQKRQMSRMQTQTRADACAKEE